MKALTTLIAISVLFIKFSHAQNLNEAIRINSTEPIGSARNLGMSGAFNGLGADITSLNYNPANAANLNKSQFSFTPYLGVTHSLSENGGYLNGKANFGLSNFSLILSEDKERWSFTYNRDADFHQKLSDQYDGSLLNHWTNQANGSSASNGEELYQLFPTSSGLAYQAFLVNHDTLANVFFPVDNSTSNQSRTVEKTGKNNTYSVSYARKLNKKTNIGLSFNLPTTNYRVESIYRESDLEPSTDHQGLEVTDRLTTTGTGINIKLGANYRIKKLIRLSAAYQTPTIMWMDQQYETDILSRSAIYGDFTANQPGSFDYYYIKPQRVDLGLGIIPNKRLAIGIDYTVQNNNESQFISNSESFDLANLNEEINNELTTMHQIRIGAEGRINNFYIRAGYSYTSSGYKELDDFSEINGISLGFGINRRTSRFDIGLVNLQRHERVYDYAPFTTNERRKINETKMAVTWTWRF